MKKTLAILVTNGVLLSSAASSAPPPTPPAQSPAAPQTATSAQTPSSVPGPMPDLPRVGDGIPHEVFVSTIRQERPLSPEQIIEIRNLKDRLDEALMRRPRGIPNAQSSTIPASFASRTRLPPVRVSIGIVSSLVFADASGNPWPILDYAVGDMSQLHMPDAKLVSDKKMNILTISPRTDKVFTNLSIMLAGAPAPLVMTLLSDQKSVDYRLDYIVEGRAPGAPAPIMDHGFTGGAPVDLMLALDGKPGDHAVELAIDGDPGTRAWKINERIILRTRLVVAAPAPLRIGRSLDGVRVYELTEVPRILALRNGEIITLTVNQ